MAMTDLTIIRRSMTARLFSTVTTVVTVAVAVALMLVLLSMRHAGERAFERGSGNMHLLVSRDSDPLGAVLNGVFYAGAPRRPIEWAKHRQIAERFPLAFAVPVQLGDSYKGFPVLATNTEFFTQFQPEAGQPWALASGRVFQSPFEVVVGAAAAREGGLRTGDTLYLTHGASNSREGDNAGAHVHFDFPYTIVGVLAPTGTPHDRALFTDLESTWIIHAHDRRRRADPSVQRTTSADLLDEDRLITGIYLQAAAPAVLPQVFSQLRADPSITVASPRQEISKLFAIVSNVDQILLAMAAAVMVSSGIAIMLALYNSMEQRRRQIAVLRVLGASRMRIFGLVVTESAILGLLGGAAGVALAWAGAQAVAAVMRARLGLVIDPALEPRSTLAVLLATVALAALAGLVPAIMGYRTPVAKNLRPLG